VIVALDASTVGVTENFALLGEEEVEEDVGAPAAGVPEDLAVLDEEEVGEVVDAPAVEVPEDLAVLDEDEVEKTDKTMGLCVTSFVVEFWAFKYEAPPPRT